jgi:hypothetical protein
MPSELRFLVVAAIVAAAPLPSAADAVVLAVDGDRVLVDVGGRDGVGAGATLELQREVVARDPSSGATLRDRFPIGKLIVVRCGEGMCEVRPDPSIRGRVNVGDPVKVPSTGATYADPWIERVAASKRPLPAAPLDTPAVDRAGAEKAVAAANAVHAVWRDTLGQPPRQRIARWQAFLDADTDSPYAPVIRTEITSLAAQADSFDRLEAAASGGPVGDRRQVMARALVELRPDLRAGARMWASVPARVRPGEPVDFAFAVPTALPDAAAWLYLRTSGQPAFDRVALTADGDAYLRARVLGDRVRAGALEWFVEVGDAPVGQGTREAPLTVAVDADVDEPPPARQRTSIETSLDYVDFDGGLAGGFDQYYQADLAFTYRFLHPVYAVRLGFGTMSGKGGPKDVIDADMTGKCMDESGTYRCRQVDFSYVYTEFELRPRPNFALMIRPQAGLLTTDASTDAQRNRCQDATALDECEFFTGVGLRARVRFGNERGTNLELGAGFTDRVGTLLEAAYHWAPHPVVPIKLAVQVTDMPVPEDFGVRMVGDVGWRGKRWVYPSLRISYQARDIDHAGLSGGLGLNFDW